MASSLSTTNVLTIGGGTNTGVAMTQLEFYTAANNNTSIGTLQLKIDSAGLATFTGNMQMGTGNTDYRNFRLGGGNSAGFLYGCYTKYGDGINIGYNFYNDNTNNVIPNSGGGTSRLRLGYGIGEFYIGGTNAEPATLVWGATATGFGVGIQSPSYKFHVQGTNAFPMGYFYDTASYCQIHVQGSLSNDTGIRFISSTRTWTAGINIGGIGASYFCIYDNTGSASRMYIDTSGNLYENGSISTNGNVTAYSSDARLKKNIVTIQNPLETLMKLRGVTWEWDKKACEKAEFTPDSVEDIGVIAQELQEVIPSAVGNLAQTEYLALKTSNYGMTALLIESVKELKKEVDELKAKLKELS
jgi:hypothetical protein